jgi:hypothetical protein
VNAPRKHQGYALFWKGKYWGSLTTGPLRPDGTHDLYLGVAGHDTHEHIWVKVTSQGLGAVGSQIKDRGDHLGGGSAPSFTTQSVARVNLRADGVGNVVTTLADVLSGSAISAAPLATTRDSSKRQPKRIDLTVPDTALAVDCEFAVVRRGSSAAAQSSTSGPVFLPFSEPSPLGMTLHVKKWSTGGPAA